MSVICEYIDDKLHDNYFAASSISSKFVALDLYKEMYEPLDSVLDGAGSLQVLSFRFNVEGSTFTENYSGMKGTAAYFNRVSKIRVYGCVFQSNSPQFSSIEF